MKHQFSNQQGSGKIHSIGEALEILNSAASDSADEIRDLITGDYKNLKKIFGEMKPEVRAAFGDLKQAAYQSVNQAKERAYEASKDAAVKVDQSVHENAWTAIGVAAGVSACLGFLLGRRTCRE